MPTSDRADIATALHRRTLALAHVASWKVGDATFPDLARLSIMAEQHGVTLVELLWPAMLEMARRVRWLEAESKRDDDLRDQIDEAISLAGDRARRCPGCGWPQEPDDDDACEACQEAAKDD